jgi:hypothetical protein
MQTVQRRKSQVLAERLAAAVDRRRSSPMGEGADVSRVHLAAPGEEAALCGAADGEVVPWEVASAPGGQHFNCPACHDALSGGQRHVSAPGDGE